MFTYSVHGRVYRDARETVPVSFWFKEICIVLGAYIVSVLFQWWFIVKELYTHVVATYYLTTRSFIMIMKLYGNYISNLHNLFDKGLLKVNLSKLWR